MWGYPEDAEGDKALAHLFTHCRFVAWQSNYLSIIYYIFPTGFVVFLDNTNLAVVVSYLLILAASHHRFSLMSICGPQVQPYQQQCAKECYSSARKIASSIP